MSGNQQQPGVSIPIFCGFVKLAQKQHGPKMAAKGIETIRSLLAEAEAIYQSLPDDLTERRKTKQ